MKKLIFLIGILLMLTGAKGLGCNNIPRDEHPERVTCSRWDKDGMTPIDCNSHAPVPAPAPEHSLQTGRQPAPSEKP